MRTARISSPEVEVQVIAIDPPEATAGEVFRATVYGSGFVRGSRVVLGSVEAAEVQVQDENTIALTVPPMVAGSVDVTVIRGDGERATLRGALTLYDEFYDPAGERGDGMSDALADCLGATVYFDLDSYRLDASASDALGGLAPCLAELGQALVIEGHTDERGTSDYNLALGQRRAEAVARYLASYGISKSLIKTVSYGEEQPAEYGHGEGSWSANRRVELTVRY